MRAASGASPAERRGLPAGDCRGAAAVAYRSTRFQTPRSTLRFRRGRLRVGLGFLGDHFLGVVERFADLGDVAHAIAVLHRPHRNLDAGRPLDDHFVHVPAGRLHDRCLPAEHRGVARHDRRPRSRRCGGIPRNNLARIDRVDDREKRHVRIRLVRAIGAAIAVGLDEAGHDDFACRVDHLRIGWDRRHPCRRLRSCRCGSGRCRFRSAARTPAALCRP